MTAQQQTKYLTPTQLSEYIKRRRRLTPLKITIVVIFLLFAGILLAAVIVDNSPNHVSNQFVKDLLANNTSDAYSNLYKTSKAAMEQQFVQVEASNSALHGAKFSKPITITNTHQGNTPTNTATYNITGTDNNIYLITVNLINTGPAADGRVYVQSFSVSKE